MLRFVWLLAFALLISVTGSRASAAPQVSIAPTLPFSMYSTHIDNCGGFAEDELTLTVSEHGKLVARNVFCSSYGREASARVVIDKSGQSFILLEYSEGRGPNATTHYLELERLQPDLLEVLQVPLSWATSPTQRFTYSYSIEIPGSGGIRIHLKGQILGQPWPDLRLNCCVPNARNLTIDISDS